MIEINEIDKKNVSIAYQGETNVYPTNFSAHSDNDLVIIDNGCIRFQVLVQQLKINGSAPTDAQEACVTLNTFIGAFKRSGDSENTYAPQVQVDWNATDQQAVDYIRNKPLINPPHTFTKVNLTNKLTGVESITVNLSTTDNKVVGTLLNIGNGFVLADIQLQCTAKFGSSFLAASLKFNLDTLLLDTTFEISRIDSFIDIYYNNVHSIKRGEFLVSGQDIVLKIDSLQNLSTEPNQLIRTRFNTFLKIK